MDVRKRTAGGVTVIGLVGALDAREAPLAQRRLEDALSDSGPVLFDMSQVTYISSAGLRTLLLLYRQADQIGTSIALTGLSSRLHDVLTATGFLRFFTVVDTVSPSDPPTGQPDHPQGVAMPLRASLTSRDSTAIIVLEGDLDATTAPTFQENVDLAAKDNPSRLILDMTKLRYVSSAGLRQIVYARQRLDDALRLVLVGTNARVTETIRLVGFDQSVTFLDSMPD